MPAPAPPRRASCGRRPGYAATRLRLVGSLWSDPAHNTNRIHVVLAEDVVPAGAHDREPGEDMETLTMPVAEAIAGVTRGLFIHAMHSAACCWRCRPPGGSASEPLLRRGGGFEPLRRQAEALVALRGDSSQVSR